MKNTNYIGLATTCHDPAIAIIDRNGTILYAESTERFLQNKRAWNIIPDNFLQSQRIIKKYCDKDADLIISTTWSNKFSLFVRFFAKPIMYFLLHFYAFGIPSELLAQYKVLTSGMLANNELNCTNLIHQALLSNSKRSIKIRDFDHHYTHAAVACYSSPFNDALCAIIDGRGEFSSTAFYSYKDGILRRIKKIKPSLGSLGFFYAYLCAACGWDPLKGEEWKVMGLASYGKFNKDFYEKLKSLLIVKNSQIIKRKSYKDIYKFLLGMKRNNNQSPMEWADIAYTGQKFFCDLMTNILCNIYKLGISDNLILGGGCALNSSYNGTILERTPFKKLHIFSAPGDDGNALGSALLSYRIENNIKKSSPSILLPYLGESMSKNKIENLSKFGKLKNILKNEDSLHHTVAQFLANGYIVGWIQGKAEFGPRALGNRSILADPRPANIKEIINAKVKFREEFRPFAPSILNEYGNQYFENYQESPYMERTLRFTKEGVGKVPGVVHSDGTGRLQTVKREWNKSYYDLIKAFHKITGIPLLLNTSFNIMGKPIIHSVEDAIAMFFTTGLDILVIEHKVYIKNE